MLDINKELQDKANKIVNEALKITPQFNDKELNDLLKGIVVLSLRQGFIWGCSSVKQTAEFMLENIQGK